MKILLMNLKRGSNWLQYDVEMEAATHRRCFVEKVFLQILQNSQENTCATVFFFKNKKTLLIKRPGTGVFLRILQNL